MPNDTNARFPNIAILLTRLANNEMLAEAVPNMPEIEYRIGFASEFFKFVVARLDDIDESGEAARAFAHGLEGQPAFECIGDFATVAVIVAARSFVSAGLATPTVPPPSVVAAAAIRAAGDVFAPGVVEVPAGADERREMVLADALCANAGGCNSLRFACQTVAMRVLTYGGAETLGTLNAAGRRLVEQRPDILFQMLVTSLEFLCCNSARIEHEPGAGYVSIPVGTPTAAS